MLFHEKNHTRHFSHEKKLDFAETGFSNLKISYWEKIAILNTLKGVLIWGLKTACMTQSPSESMGRGGGDHLVTALLPTVHSPVGNQVIPVIKLIYNTSNRRVVLKGSQQYWLKSQWDAGEITIAHLIHLEMPLAGNSANPRDWGHGDSVS